MPWSPSISISSHSERARSGPLPAGSVSKAFAQRVAQLGGRHRRQAAEQAVRGEDQHAGVAHRDEHHQDVVGRVLGWQSFAALSKLSR